MLIDALPTYARGASVGCCAEARRAKAGLLLREPCGVHPLGETAEQQAADCWRPSRKLREPRKPRKARWNGHRRLGASLLRKPRELAETTEAQRAKVGSLPRATAGGPAVFARESTFGNCGNPNCHAISLICETIRIRFGLLLLQAQIRRPAPGSPSPAPVRRSCAGCAAPRACPWPARQCDRNAPCRSSLRPGSAACRVRG